MAGKTYCVQAYDAKTGAVFDEAVFDAFYFADEDHGGNAEPAALEVWDEMRAWDRPEFVEWRMLIFG